MGGNMRDYMLEWGSMLYCARMALGKNCVQLAKKHRERPKNLSSWEHGGLPEKKKIPKVARMYGLKEEVVRRVIELVRAQKRSGGNHTKKRNSPKQLDEMFRGRPRLGFHLRTTRGKG